MTTTPKTQLVAQLKKLEAVVSDIVALYDAHEELNNEVSVKFLPKSLDEWHGDIVNDIEETEALAQWTITDDASHESGGGVAVDMIRWERGDERYEVVKTDDGDYGMEYYADADAEPQCLGKRPTRQEAYLAVQYYIRRKVDITKGVLCVCGRLHFDGYDCESPKPSYPCSASDSCYCPNCQ